MRLVIFGLTISSSFGNGHATLWRGLCRSLVARSHNVTFFERDVDYYRSSRDLFELEGGKLVFYSSWEDVQREARAAVESADVVLVTSYCPDGRRASELALEHAHGLRVYYDLDTPVTLAAIERGEYPPYLCERGLADFDLVLSFTGGLALDLLQKKLGARRVAPLYGHADPEIHHPTRPSARYRSSLSYLGTYSQDRQTALEELFIDPARLLPLEPFQLAGSLYPSTEDFPPNIQYWPHLAPAEHAAFFASSRLTLNITRQAMARLGYCPSGRLFEAAASRVPIVSDWFLGLEQFFEPGREIIVANTRSEVVNALSLGDEELERMAGRARERLLAEHRSAHRAEELLTLLSSPTLGVFEASGAESVARRAEPTEA